MTPMTRRKAIVSGAAAVAAALSAARPSGAQTPPAVPLVIPAQPRAPAGGGSRAQEPLTSRHDAGTCYRESSSPLNTMSPPIRNYRSKITPGDDDEEKTIPGNQRQVFADAADHGAEQVGAEIGSRRL